MSDEFEAAGTAVEGGLIANAIEGESGNPVAGSNGTCLNCGATVTQKYCGNCSQPLQAHRTIRAFGHDILHGVLHFDGKFWRTLPLLAWKPGHLTRRYVRGERAKFISPMALFLFSIFMMFAVFSFLGDPFSSNEIGRANNAFSIELTTQVKENEDQIQAKISQLLNATGDNKVKLEKEILELKKGGNILANMAGKEPPYPDVSLDDGNVADSNLSADNFKKIETGLGDIKDGKALTDGSVLSTGSPETDKWIRDAIKKIGANPELLIYKLKTNGYKFAWLLIPISLPLVWLALLGRRGFHFYDHAVFTTYSISFMSLLFIGCAILAAVGVSESIWVPLAVFYPPFHMYRQIRHAYGLGRIEALIRALALSLFTIVSLLAFFLVLLALGL